MAVQSPAGLSFCIPPQPLNPGQEGIPLGHESNHLFTYLAHDPRPSLVLIASERSPLFRNRAFFIWQEALASRHEGTTAHVADTELRNWYSAIAAAPKTCQSIFGGCNWLVAPMSPDWVVVTNLESPCLPQQQTAELLATPQPISLDWTRVDLPGLSDHIKLVKSFMWQKTDLGTMAFWSDTLRHLVLSMMSNPNPQILLWGPSRTMIYNEPCAPILGQKHPQSLGDIAANVWQEAMVVLDPIITGVATNATGVQLPSMPVIMHRSGFDEECFYNINFTPVIGSCGKCLGVMDQFTDCTEHVIRERRRVVAADVDATLASQSSLDTLRTGFLAAIERAKSDIPFALLYAPEPDHQSHPGPCDDHHFDCRTRQYLFGSVGLGSTPPESLSQGFQTSSSPADGDHSIAAACQRAWQSRSTVILHSADDTLPSDLALPCPAQPGSLNAVNTVCVIPISDVSQKVILGFLVLAFTPGRPFDDAAAHFLDEVGNIYRGYAQTIFFPQAQNRLLRQFEETESILAQRVRDTRAEADKMELRQERIFQMAPIGVFSYNADAQCIFHNDAYLRITGITSEQLADPAFRSSSVVHEDDHDRVLKHWEASLHEKQPFSIEYRLSKTWYQHDEATNDQISGETWIYATAVPEVDEDGKTTLVTGFLVDISDRKYNEDQRNMRADAERTEAPFKRLAESAPMGMYHLYPDGSPKYCNDSYFSLSGVTRDYQEMMQKGKDWDAHIHEDDRTALVEGWKDLVQKGTPLNMEYRVKKPWRYYDSVTDSYKTGQTWLQGTAIADRDAQGKTQSVLGFVSEISAKKFSEKLLAERLEEALETKRQADRFIDMTSHEMRNPLSAILQSADAILTALTEEVADATDDVVVSQPDPAVLADTVVDAAQTIILCAQHQKRIVDDILTLSKLDTKLLVIFPDKASPVDLLRKCIKMYEAEIRRADANVTCIIEQSYQKQGFGKVMLDSSRLLQVVINLLSNAIKFSQNSSQREIKVYLGASIDRPSGPFHEAAFVPQKPGRADPTKSTEWGSGETAYLQIAVADSGCGLNPDELKVMFHRFAQASPKTYKQYGGSGLGLFISRELTELQGGQIGVHSEAGKGSTFTFYVKVRRASSGDDGAAGNDTNGGLDAVVRSQSVMQTPRMNPLQPVRSQSTVSAGPVERVMTPPVRSEADVRARRSGLIGLHVLVVEDNVINQRVMASQLRRLGCTVHIAHHGGEALQFLGYSTFWNGDKAGPMVWPAGSGHHGSPSLMGTPMPASITPPPTPLVPLSVILMDLEMPVLGGLDTIKEIRRLEKIGHLTGHVPVIAITANARNEQIQDAIHSGMDSVVTKPFRIPDLLPLMEAVLHERPL